MLEPTSRPVSTVSTFHVLCARSGAPRQRSSRSEMPSTLPPRTLFLFFHVLFFIGARRSCSFSVGSNLIPHLLGNRRQRDAEGMAHERPQVVPGKNSVHARTRKLFAQRSKVQLAAVKAAKDVLQQSILGNP